MPVTLTVIRLGSPNPGPGSSTAEPPLRLPRNPAPGVLDGLGFVLDGLGQPELEAYTSRQVRARDRLSYPFRPIIGALNESRSTCRRHSYHTGMYRAEALSVTEIVTLDQQPGPGYAAAGVSILCHAGGPSALRVVHRAGALDDALGGQLLAAPTLRATRALGGAGGHSPRAVGARGRRALLVGALPPRQPAPQAEGQRRL